MSKKLLVNMNDIFEHDKTVNKSDLEMNVLDAMKVNDGLYFIPTGFAFRAFIGDGNMIKNSNVKIDDKKWNWKEFGELSKEIIQQAGKDGKNKLYALTDYPAEMTLKKWLLIIIICLLIVKRNKRSSTRLILWSCWNKSRKCIKNKF